MLLGFDLLVINLKGENLVGQNFSSGKTSSLGGALMAWVELGISPELFRLRLIEGTDVSHVLVGMVKAPVFALVIGVIGCRDGLRVESTTESLGRMTSTSVVSAVFAVIVIDAVFSIFFAQLGI